MLQRSATNGSTTDSTDNERMCGRLARFVLVQVHFRATVNKHPLGLGPSKKGKEWNMPHEIWTEEEVNAIQVRRIGVAYEGNP